MGPRLASLVLALAGCHAVYPYGFQGGPVLDSQHGGAPETGTPGDAGDPESGTPPGVRPVACPMPVGPCLECDPITQSFCGGSCPAGDCDALPDPRDPWPAVCNQLRFAEDFCGGLANWEKAYADGSAEIVEPGLIAITVRDGPGPWAEWIYLSPAAASGVDGKLVELRFQPPQAAEWDFVLETDVPLRADGTPHPDDGRGCMITRGFGRGYELAALVTVAGEHGEARAPANWSPGPALLLSWIADNAHHCRLVSEADPGPPPQVSVLLPGPLPAPGTIVLAGQHPGGAGDLRIPVDYLRVFDPG